MKSNGKTKRATGKEGKNDRTLKESVEKKTIIDNVLRLKDERNISNAELAQLLGYSASTVCAWESRTRGITSKALPRIADVFNVEISELFKSSPSFAVKEEDSKEAKFRRIRTLLYDFSDDELECVIAAITSMWKLIYGNEEKAPDKTVTY